MNDKLSMPLAQFFEEVYRPRRLVQATPASAYNYSWAIKTLERFLDRPATLADLNEETAMQFVSGMLKEGRAVVSVNGLVNHLKTLALFARKKRYIEIDLSEVDSLRVPKQLPTAWTVAEMEGILKSCAARTGRVSGVAAAAWWTALVLVGFDTGIRRRALFAIRFNDLDFEHFVLRVPAESMKTLVAQSFKLHPQTIEAILATVPPDRELVFPLGCAICTIETRWKEILIDAGLDCGRREGFHKLRRTCASHIAAKLGEAMAQKQLGHSDPSCIKRYIDPTFTASHELALSLPRPLWTNPREVIVTRAEGPVQYLGKPLKIILPADGLGHRGAIDRIAESDKIRPADLRAAIEEMGLGVVDFCKEGSFRPERVWGIIRGKKTITPHYDRRIRKALGIRRQLPKADLLRIRRHQQANQLRPIAEFPTAEKLENINPARLIDRFGREYLATYSEFHRKQVLSRLRFVLTIDGAASVSALAPAATLTRIVEEEAAGKIGRQGAKMCRISLRLFLRWLVYQHGVESLFGELNQLDRRFTMLARRNARKEGNA